MYEIWEFFFFAIWESEKHDFYSEKFKLGCTVDIIPISSWLLI